MRLLTLPLLLASLCALLAGTAHAQLYRSVSPDGRVTYSDQPPAATEPRAGSPTGPKATSGAAPAPGSLPYELRQIAQRYPVTLYTGNDCTPCNSGRNLLINRGIPFVEKTVVTAEDMAALKRLTGAEPGVPLLTIGKQQLKGYSDADWSQYLDAAGYPKTAQLPSGYQRPAPTPLVATQPVAAIPPATAATEEPQPATGSHTVTPRGTANNPAGIRF